MADDRLDGGAALHLALDGGGRALHLARYPDAELVCVVAAIAFIDVDSFDLDPGIRLDIGHGRAKRMGAGALKLRSNTFGATAPACRSPKSGGRRRRRGRARKACRRISSSMR